MVACQHLVEHHRATELVAAWINYSACLLRCHVAHRATHRYCLAYARAWLQGARNPKVGNNQAAIFLVNQNVLWLDVTMNERTRARMCILVLTCQLWKIGICICEW